MYHIYNQKKIKKHRSRRRDPEAGEGSNEERETMICDNLVGLRGRLPLHALRCHSVNYKKKHGHQRGWRVFPGALRRLSQGIPATRSRARVRLVRDPQGTAGSGVLTMATWPGWTEPQSTGHSHIPLLRGCFCRFLQIGLRVEAGHLDQGLNAAMEAFQKTHSRPPLRSTVIKGCNRVHSGGLFK